MSNWVTISKQDINPKKDIIGNFPMLMGTLKGLSNSGFLYLNHISERLTSANVMKTPKLVIPATNCMSPIKIKTIEKTIIQKIAIHGVLVLS